MDQKEKQSAWAKRECGRVREASEVFIEFRQRHGAR